MMCKTAKCTIGAAGAFLVCLLLVSSASAAPAWLGPADLSSVNAFWAENPNVAADQEGDLVAVWDQDVDTSQVVASVRPAGGGWQPPVVISKRHDESELPVVAVDPRGDATAVFFDSEGIVYAASRPAGGGWSAPVELDEDQTNGDLFDPDQHVAVDADGDAVAVWASDTDGDESMLAAVRPAGGAWEPPVTLDSGEYTVANPRVAIDPRGDVTAVWTSTSSARANTFVWAAVRPAGKSWETPVDLSDSGQNAAEPQVAVDPHGNTTAVWDLFSGTSRGGPSHVVQAATRPAGGSWQTQVDLSAGFTSESSAQPEVAVDAQGDATAVWDLYDGSSYITQAAARPAGGSWQPPVDLATGGHTPTDPQVALDPHGDATAVWDLDDGTSRITQAAARPAGGSWQPAVDLSRPGARLQQEPQVTADPQGNVTAIWQFCDDDGQIVQADGYAAAGPQLRALSIPAAGTAGIPMSFSVSPLDVWSPVASTNWSFGDGQTATDDTVTHTYTNPGSYTVRASSVDTLSNTTSTTANITIAPAPTQTTPTPATLALTHVSQAHRRWREGAKHATIARKPKRAPVGTSFSFTVNETARVGFAFTQTVSGRKVSGKCQPSTKHNHGDPRCRRTITRATPTYTTTTGRHQLAFQGQTSKHKRLPPGAYTLTLTATNASGRRSRPHTLRFTIVR
jgi:PKD repeat protein